MAAQACAVSIDHVEQLESYLDKASMYLRGITLGLRSCYSTETPFISSFTDFKRAAYQQAATLREYLLPLTQCMIINIVLFLNNYTEMALDAWAKRIDEVHERATEYQRLFEGVVASYKCMAAELKKWGGPGKVVLDELNLDVAKLHKDIRTLRVRSKVVEDMFLALLFVPDVSNTAVPYVHGGAERDFRRPDVAKTPGELAAAATMAMTITVTQSVDNMIQVMTSIANFFKVVAQDIGQHKLLAVAEDPSLKDRQRAHYDIIKKRIFHIMRRLNDLVAWDSLYKADVDCIPLDREKYPKKWIEETNTESGVSVADCIREATRNFEIRGCLDI